MNMTQIHEVEGVYSSDSGYKKISSEISLRFVGAGERENSKDRKEGRET